MIALSLVPVGLLDPSRVARVTVRAAALDPTAARDVLRETSDAFASGARAVVLDLSRVTFIDSLGVSALVAASKRAPAGTRVVLCSLGAYAQTVARVTHLHEIFAIYASAEAAVAALTG